MIHLSTSEHTCPFKIYFQSILVKTIFDRSWLGYFRSTSTKAISTDISPNIFRSTSTRTIFRLKSVSAFSINVNQGCFWSILCKIFFLLRSARVCSQCQLVIIFSRHQLGIFLSTLIVTSFWTMLVRVLWPTSIRFVLGRCRSLIFFANINHDYFLVDVG